MSDYTRTPNLQLYKPTYLADGEQWGTHINLNADTLDASITALQTGGVFLPTSGGAMAGPLITITTGSPVSRSVQDRATDFLTPKDYGAICDGNSHPLSSRFSTLAAAQAVYPVATALTDEIDWCAIQTLINSGVANLNLSAGTYLINHPLTSSNGIAVTGQGVDATTIVQTLAGADGWQHTSSGHFKAYNLSFKCNGAGGCAFNLVFSGSVAGLTMRELNIGGNGNQTANYWHDGIKSVGPGLIDLTGVFVVGIQAALLSNVGNGLYVAPTASNVSGCYQIAIKNSTFDYWQNAIVFDSAGNDLGHNIQGVVLDWVNCVGCMQFVRVLSSILELVMHKCQGATYGAAVYVQQGYSSVIRDCYFIVYAPDATRAITAQLPQDVLYFTDGGTWWIEDNRIQINSSATVNYVVNFQGAFVGAVLRANSVYTNGATCTGYINIASGVTVIDERSTQFGFWGSWPKVTNPNANGGTRNMAALGTLTAIDAPVSDNWQQQGTYIGWNYTSARGATDFINSHGSGAGGYYFYTTSSSPGATPTLLAQISNNAIFTCNGTITKLVTSTGTAYSLAATDSSLVLTPTGTFTLTPGPASGGNVNRSFYVKSTAAFAVNSNAPNIVQLTGGSSTTAILPATAGKWAWLQSDGSNWQIMASN